MDMVAGNVERIASQQNHSTLTTQFGSRSGQPELAYCASASTRLEVLISATSGKVCILGLTTEGKTFRPSDWAERLAGAMSSFRPAGSAGGIGAYIGYSPYCVPNTTENGVKCVVVSEELRSLEPMAWDFVMNFARDNKLRSYDTDTPMASPK